MTHKNGLVVGARSFPGNPYDGHVLSAQLGQTNILLEGAGKLPKQVFVDLGCRGVDHDNPNVEIILCGKYKSLTRQQRRCLRRRPAVEPTIGHLKTDHRMDRCWLRGQLGDALHTVLCATGFSSDECRLRWRRAPCSCFWPAVEHHDGDAGGEQQAVPANAALRALQARHWLADRLPLSTQCE